MKLIYLTVDGRARMESSKIGTRMVEMPDRYHPLTNDSVWQDARRRADPAVVIIQGVLGPYGATMANHDIRVLLYEIKLAEKAFKPASVSKMWQRMLGRFVDWIMKYGIIVSVVLFIMYYVVQAMFGGGS